MNRLTRFAKNLKGYNNGFGGCDRCGDRWSWKKHHSLQMSDRMGCFSLCEECWQESTKEEKFKYYLGHLYKYPNRGLNIVEADKRLRDQIEEYHSSEQKVNEE